MKNDVSFYSNLFLIRISILILVSIGFISSLYLTISSHRTEEVHYTTLFRMAPWSAWQAEREFYNFREALYLYTHAEDNHDKNALLLRYEILLSRLAILQEGGVVKLIRDMPGVLDKVQAFEETLLAFEQRLEAHQPRDLQTLAEIDRELRAHGPFLRALSDRSVLGPEIGRVRRSIVDAYVKTRASSWALSGFSLLLVLLLVVEIVIGRRNAQAAEASSRRGAELARELGRFKDRVEFFTTETGHAFCVTRVSEDGVVLYEESKNFSDVVGYPINDVKTLDALLKVVHPGDRERVREACQRPHTEGRPAIEFRVQHGDGKIHWLAYTRIVIETHNDSTETLQVFQDVTELRMATEVMQQSARLLTLGELAAGLAHEINQPLSVIRLSTYNASGRLRHISQGADSDYLRNKLDRIIEQVTRTERLTEQMMAFSRPDPGTLAGSFRISAALFTITEMIGKEFQVNRIDLVCDNRSADIEVSGNIEMLEQALINIILNARDAIIDARERGDVDRGHINILVEPLPRTRVVSIRISDNGGGIAPDVMDTLFAPFVTTKPPGKGTGLGLWIASALITRLGGTVTAHNSEEGAVFSVQIPKVAQTSQKAGNLRHAET